MYQSLYLAVLEDSYTNRFVNLLERLSLDFEQFEIFKLENVKASVKRL